MRAPQQDMHQRAVKFCVVILALIVLICGVTMPDMLPLLLFRIANGNPITMVMIVLSVVGLVVVTLREEFANHRLIWLCMWMGLTIVSVAGLMWPLK